MENCNNVANEETDIFESVVVKEEYILPDEDEEEFVDPLIRPLGTDEREDTLTGKRVYKCVGCEKTFRRIQHLKEHERIHTGERPYNCAVCGKDFRTKGTLTKHLRAHVGERLYKCAVCEKDFRTPTSLQLHSQIHTDEHPKKRDMNIYIFLEKCQESTVTPKRREICVDERKMIIKLWEEGKTIREIGHLIGRSHCSIYTVIKNYRNTGIITPKPRSGRPTKLTLQESCSMLNMVKANPRLTATQIARDVQERFDKNISAVTARRILRRADFHARVSRK